MKSSRGSPLDPLGPEYILTAIGSSGANSLKHIYIDCPAVPADTDDDGQKNKPLGLGLPHCAQEPG